MTPIPEAYAEYHYSTETPKAPAFPLSDLPVAPFIHGPSPTLISPSTSISSDEDYTGDRGEHPFFSDTEMGMVKPVRDLEAEKRANPAYPTPFDFDTIIYDYLSGLSQKKREKALLNRTMYQAVLYVHHAPKDTSFKTAQFRFWAKKMFSTTQYSGEEVLTHDHKPVAVREQIYEVLIHCHTQAAHGGRDKTSIQVRKYYSWIPKDIIAKFVSKCPSCRSKRTLVGPDVGAMTKSQEYFVAIQETEHNLTAKKPISLQAARVAAHQAGRRNLAKLHREAAQREQGRVHMVNGSQVMPQNPVYYDNSQQPQPPQHLQQPQTFGQSNYFQPPTQPPIGALPRSTSFDGTAARQQYIHMQNQSVEMHRRVSESGAGRYAVQGVEATPRASQVLRQNQRSIMPHMQISQTPSIPELHLNEAQFDNTDSLADVRAGCRSHAEEQLMSQDLMTSGINMPMQNLHITQDQIDPSLHQQCAEMFQATQTAQAAAANSNQVQVYNPMPLDPNMIDYNAAEMGSMQNSYQYGYDQVGNTHLLGMNSTYLLNASNHPVPMLNSGTPPITQYSQFDMNAYAALQPHASGSGSGSLLPAEEHVDFDQFLNMEEDPVNQFLHSDPADEFDGFATKGASGSGSGSGGQDDIAAVA